MESAALALYGWHYGPWPAPGAEPGILAPVSLAPQAELRRLATATAVLTPGEAVSPALRTAADAAAPTADPLRMLRAVIDGYLQLGPLAWRAGGPRAAGRWRRAADRRLPVALLSLYELADDQVVDAATLAQLTATTDAHGQDAAPLADLETELRDVVADLRAAGVLAGDGHEHRLSALGRWYVRECLLRAGFVAPLAGEFADADPEMLLRAAAQWDPPVAARELAAWVRGRPAAAAVAAIALAVRAAPDPAPLVMAPAAWSAIGPDAVPHVRALADDARLRPAVLAWARDTGQRTGSPTDADVVTVVALRSWAALHRGGMAAMTAAVHDHFPDPAAADRVVAALWRAPQALAGPVVDALLVDGPAGLAAAARRARLRARTAGVWRAA